MNYSIIFCIFLFKTFSFSFSINYKLLEIEPSRLTDVMKAFMIRIIEENCLEKNGFLFGIINAVESEYSDFVAKELHKKNTVVTLNLDQYSNVDFDLNPNHFKFALADPEVDLSNSGEIFTKIKVSRARVLLILTKPPIQLVIDYILNSYYQVKSINIIIAYEFEGRVEVVTFNPYLPSSHKTQNLTNSKTEFFYEKTRNLYGTKIKCLLTYRDRTKIIRKTRNNHVSYEGKDYWAIYTILNHLNGNLEIITMDNVLLNPWFESLNLVNKTKRKKIFLENRDISIFIKSEQFTMDDEIIENLYPHTQNDLTSVAPKSLQVPTSNSLLSLYSLNVWMMFMFTTIVLTIIWVIYKKKFNQTVWIQKIYFDILRILLTSNLYPFPKNLVERIFIFAYILGAYIISIFVQSKITSFLAIKKFYPEIDTIEDLFLSGLPIYSIPIYITDIKTKYVGTKFEKYTESLIALTTNEGLMDQMIYKIDVEQMPVFLTEYDIALFISRFSNFRKNGVQVYHLVKESIIPNFQSYKVIHNSPLLPMLNKKLRLLEEGGFINLWAKRTIFNATIEGFLYPENNDELPTANPLTLDVVMMWFLFLFLCYIVTSLIFIGEILTNKKHEKKKFLKNQKKPKQHV